ncbi:MAG: KGG domain-containing protein [Patescibacteria group bacterium]
MAREDRNMGDEGEMTVREAGHKGGETTSETHGHEFYEEIGHKGGEATSQTHGRDFYEEIGRKGGERVRELIEKGEEIEEGEEE